MHELSLMADLMRKLESIAREQRPRKIVSVRLKLGALSHISSDRLREHFAHVARGTAIEGTRLDIDVLADVTDLHAQDILLVSVEVEA